MGTNDTVINPLHMAGQLHSVISIPLSWPDSQTNSIPEQSQAGGTGFARTGSLQGCDPAGGCWAVSLGLGCVTGAALGQILSAEPD